MDPVSYLVNSQQHCCNMESQDVLRNHSVSVFLITKNIFMLGLPGSVSILSRTVLSHSL